MGQHVRLQCPKRNKEKSLGKSLATHAIRLVTYQSKSSKIIFFPWHPTWDTAGIGNGLYSVSLCVQEEKNSTDFQYYFLKTVLFSDNVDICGSHHTPTPLSSSGPLLCLILCESEKIQ